MSESAQRAESVAPENLLTSGAGRSLVPDVTDNDWTPPPWLTEAIKHYKHNPTLCVHCGGKLYKDWLTDHVGAWKHLDTLLMLCQPDEDAPDFTGVEVATPNEVRCERCGFNRLAHGLWGRKQGVCKAFQNQKCPCRACNPDVQHNDGDE